MFLNDNGKIILNINDVFRNNLLEFYKNFDDGLSNHLDFVKFLTKFLEESSIDIKTSYLSLMYLDAYKILNYNFKESNLNINEINMFGYLKNVNNIKDLFYYFDIKDYAFEFICKWCKKFIQSNEFEKRTYFLDLEDKDNEKLKKINVFHELDLKKYNSKLNCNDLLNLNNKIIEQEFDNIYTSEILLEEYIVNSISSYMQKLVCKNKGQFDSLYREMLKVVYSYHKYIIDHGKFLEPNENLFVNIVESSSYKDLCSKALNRDYLKLLIEMFIYYETYEEEEYFDFRGNRKKNGIDEVLDYSKTFTKTIRNKLDIK